MGRLTESDSIPAQTYTKSTEKADSRKGMAYRQRCTPSQQNRQTHAKGWHTTVRYSSIVNILPSLVYRYTYPPTCFLFSLSINGLPRRTPTLFFLVPPLFTSLSRPTDTLASSLPQHLVPSFTNTHRTAYPPNRSIGLGLSLSRS